MSARKYSVTTVAISDHKAEIVVRRVEKHLVIFLNDIAPSNLAHMVVYLNGRKFLYRRLFKKGKPGAKKKVTR